LGYPLQRPIPLKSDAEILKLPPTAIGPGSGTNLARNLGRALTPFEIQSLATNAMSLYVYGKVLYRDVFGIQRYTEYCLGWAGNYPPPVAVGLTFVEYGNRAN
jgi:hypothetical protein